MESETLVERRAAGFPTYDTRVELVADQAAETLKYTRLDHHRSQRIARKWRLSEEPIALPDTICAPETSPVPSEPRGGGA